MSAKANTGNEIQVTIDDKTLSCLPGEYIADVAKRANVYIPLLCGKQEALVLGRGRCRVCIVEIVESGRTKVVTACNYPVQRNCDVFTKSERIIKERGVIFALLKHLAPDSRVIAEMADANNAPHIKRLEEPEEKGACILCGLCVEACKAQGTGAISTVGRGVEKQVSTPFGEESSDCIGCGVCASVCPTSSISLKAADNTRTTLTFMDAQNM
jgi:NADH dehydrogenase/NADH:ubiquinone oxidoreductase subunit G